MICEMTSRDRITCSDFSFTTQNRLKKSEKYAIILKTKGVRIMANEAHKIKLLVLWDILCKNTDESHALQNVKTENKKKRATTTSISKRRGY